MDDIFGKKLQGGDIVIYAARHGSKQIPCIAIVIDPEGTYNNKFRISVRTVDDVYAKARVYKVKPANFINPGQVIKITDPAWLEPLMVERLRTSYELELKKLHKKNNPSPTRGMTPGQRHAYHLQQNRDAGLYADPAQEVQDAITNEIRSSKSLGSI